MRRKIHKFLTAPNLMKAYLIQAFAEVLAMRLLLAILPFQQFKKFYNRLLATPKSDDVAMAIIQQKACAVQVVSKPLGAVCLPQALALKYILRKDPTVKIIIGIQLTKDGGSVATNFLAHAWVEKNGQIVLGNLPNTSFKPLWQWS